MDYLVRNNILGFERLPNSRVPTPRYYTLNLNAFRGAILNTASRYLRLRLTEPNILTKEAIDEKMDKMVPLIVNACVSALYAKLYAIHQAFNTYTNRFLTTPTYHDGMELPLPFADAIANIGVYTPGGSVDLYNLVPVYPENIHNEGRIVKDGDDDDDGKYDYEWCMNVMKDLGVPLKCVDTEVKSGSPWWTMRPVQFREEVDFQCVFSASNYSDDAVLTAVMFLYKDEEGVAKGVVDPRDDDLEYGFRCWEMTDVDPHLVFAARCNAPMIEWSQ